MNNKLLLSAAVLSIAFGFSACSTHKGMMKEDKGMGGKDNMMKDNMEKGMVLFSPRESGCGTMRLPCGPGRASGRPRLPKPRPEQSQRPITPGAAPSNVGEIEHHRFPFLKNRTFLFWVDTETFSC